MDNTGGTGFKSFIVYSNEKHITLEFSNFERFFTNKMFIDTGFKQTLWNKKTMKMNHVRI